MQIDAKVRKKPSTRVFEGNVRSVESFTGLLIYLPFSFSYEQYEESAAF